MSDRIYLIYNAKTKSILVRNTRKAAVKLFDTMQEDFPSNPRKIDFEFLVRNPINDDGIYCVTFHVQKGFPILYFLKHVTREQFSLYVFELKEDAIEHAKILEEKCNDIQLLEKEGRRQIHDENFSLYILPVNILSQLK